MKNTLKRKRPRDDPEETNIYIGNLKNSAKCRPKLDLGDEELQQPQSVRCIPDMGFNFT